MTCDIAAYVRALPKGNEDIDLVRSEQRLGGSGTDCAEVLGGLHLAYDLMAPCGSGVYGDAVLTMAKERKIELHCRREQVEGCTYRMIDPEGKESLLSVPGAEYSYEEEDTDAADSDEISAILCFGEMLTGENALSLADFMYRCDVPVYLVPDGYLEDMDDDVRESLLSLDACWILQADEISSFMDEKDLLKAVRRLSGMTSKPVVVMMGKEGILCCCGGEEVRTPSTEAYDSEHEIHTAETAFAAACVSGVDLRNSLMFAQGAAERLQKNRGVMDEYDWNEQRQRLVRMITYRS